MVLLLSISLVFLSVFADDTDPRLGAVRTAFVTPFDKGSYDASVAVCLANHLATRTPLTSVESRDVAEVWLTVRTHFPGNPARPVPDGLGNVRVVVTLPDGTKLWSGIEILRDNRLQPSDIPCALADGIADQLREAIRKVQSAKKK